LDDRLKMLNMKQGWKLVKLGEVLAPSRNSVVVIPTNSYTLLGMSLEGRGLFVREQKLGSEIGAKYLNMVIPGEFMYSRLFAWKGAFDKVLSKFEGCFVSDEYPAFQGDKERLDIDYLSYFFLQKSVWDVVEQYCVGVTKASRNRFKETFFLDLEIPLPPLAEQQEIAGRLTALKEKIDEVRRLREEQERMIIAFRNGLFTQISNGFDMVELKRILIPRKEVVSVASQTSYNQITVKMQHKGVILRGTVLGSEVGSLQLKAREGDFIISKIDARNGAMGLVPKSLDNAIVTNDFPLFSFSSVCIPKYFEFVSNTNYFDQKCIQSSEGTTNRVRLKMDRFASIQVPLPPVSEQKRLVDILEKIDQLKAEQTRQLLALEVVFPAVLGRAFRGEW
jgi:type I restriction enzyme, S subunit